MYNENVKRLYIKQNSERNRNLEAQAAILFNRCEPYEVKLEKDICCFSTNEIIECLKSFNSVSLESLLVACSQYKLYVDWCIANHVMTKDYQNHFREIGSEVLRQCLNPYLKEYRTFTREWIMGNMDNLINPRERFILLGTFEGIGAGTKLAYEEFIDLKLNMFDTETHTLNLSPTRSIGYSDELYKLACEAADTYEYITYGRHGCVRHYKLEQNDNIIKFCVQARTYDYKNFMSKELRIIKQAFNNPAITFQSLKESGRIEMINKLIKGGMSLEEALSDKGMIATYGKVQAKKRYISNYFAE